MLGHSLTDDLQFSTWIYLMHQISGDNSLSDEERFPKRIFMVFIGQRPHNFK